VEMSTGFLSDYEEAIIRGNLSLEPHDNPLVNGDGSLEVAGTIYTDTILQFNTQGILVGDVKINSDSMFVPFSQASIGWTAGALLVHGGITIQNTTECTSPSSGGGLTVFGGASIVKGLCMGSHIHMHGNLVRDLALLPLLPGDAASKDYVDYVAGNVSGNFTTGQVIIAQTVGTAIRGFDSFTFDGSSLILGPGTNLFINSTLANSLVTLGGATIGGMLSMSENRITNVADPINGHDAVNLDFLQNYVTDSLEDCAIIGDDDILYERSLTLLQTITPEYVPLLEFSGDDLNFFECYIFTQTITESFSLHILRGFFNGTWTMFVQYPGQGTNDVLYNIETIGTLGKITYTNQSSSPVYIRYRKFFELQTTDPGYEVFSATTSGTFTDITGLIYDQNTKKAFKLIVVSSTSGYILNGVYNISTGLWSINTSTFGNISSIQFTIVPSTGQIQYRNSGANDTLSYKELINLNNTALVTLTNSTFTPIDTTLQVHNGNQYKTFTYYLYAYTNTKSSFFTIYGVFYSGTLIWSIHSTYVGNLTDLHFSVVTSGDTAILYYTNDSLEDAYVSNFTEFPPIYRNPICVNKGGTGTTDFLPYALVRGNGQRHLIATDEIIFYDNRLILNNLASIWLTNISSSLLSYGSGEFQGDFSVGRTLDVNGNNIINVATPINGTDAVNKDYITDTLDNYLTYLTQFTSGQVLVGGSDGTLVTGYSNFTFNTTGILSVPKVTDLITPTNALDATNKTYVDSLVTTSVTTSRDELTQFTNGQVLIGGSNGNVINGYSNLTFHTSGTLNVPTISTGNITITNSLDMTGNIIINVTSPSNNTDVTNKLYVDSLVTTSVTTIRDELTQFTNGQILVGGSDGNVINGYSNFTFNTSGILNVSTISTGNVSVTGILDVNNTNIVNVLEPVNGKDAVNKDYLTMWFECGFYGTNDDSEFETTKILQYSLSPIDIPGLIFTEHAFYTFIYTRTVLSGKSAFYTIKGFKNSSNIWTINTEYTGDPFGELTFSITPSGQIQYINNDPSQILWLKYRMFYKNDAVLTNIPITMVPITLKVYPNVTNYAFKTNITSNGNNTIIYAYRKSVTWYYDALHFGVSGPAFTVYSSGINAELQYTSTNADSLYIKDIVNIESTSMLIQSIPYTQFENQAFNPIDTKSFYMIIYTSNSTKAGLVEIKGLYSETSNWRLNKRYIGDKLLEFKMTSNNLEYATLDPEDTEIGWSISIAPLNTPLCVTKGGTGAREFIPTALLLGNGTLPVYSTSKLTFDNNSLRITGNILVNDIDITPFRTEVSLGNNIIIPTGIPEVTLTEKGYTLKIIVTLTDDTGDIDEMFELKVVKLNSGGWLVDDTSVGGTTGVNFTIDPGSGVLEYTSGNTPNWVSTSARITRYTL